VTVYRPRVQRRGGARSSGRGNRASNNTGWCRVTSSTTAFSSVSHWRLVFT